MRGDVVEPASHGRFFAPASGGLQGTLSVPGDKSVSHRAVLLGAVNQGPLTVAGFLRSADTLSTIRAVRALGVAIDEVGEDLTVHGQGWEGLQEPDDVIDVGNAGTLIRLLPGLVASKDFLCVLTGDASIRRRPMARVTKPLAMMGAWVAGRDNGSLPPIAIRGGALRGMAHDLEIASAQVKSCLLLAGLRAQGPTRIVEPALSRDHTERMIAFAGGRIERQGLPGGRSAVTVWPSDGLHMQGVSVPGDFSSAAFFIVGALLVPGSDVRLEGVGLNPTRTGLLDVLLRMGARIEVGPSEGGGVEPVGELRAVSSALTGTEITPEEVPSLIDDLPLFLLAAARADGISRLRGAADLRAKESDRLAAMTALLRSLGVTVTEHHDGMDVLGSPGGWRGAAVRSVADHRLAMVGAIAGAASTEGVVVDDVDCVEVSYPGFVGALDSLGGASRPAPPPGRVPQEAP